MELRYNYEKICNTRFFSPTPFIAYNALSKILKLFIQIKSKLTEICDNGNLLFISILDLLSSKLLHSIIVNWGSVSVVDELARKEEDNLQGIGQQYLNFMIN